MSQTVFKGPEYAPISFEPVFKGEFEGMNAFSDVQTDVISASGGKENVVWSFDFVDKDNEFDWESVEI